MIRTLRLQVVFCLLVVFAPAPASAQSGAVIPQGGAGHANQASCIILKRTGPADQVTSHLYSFGIRGKQFQYVEGKLPEGFPFHGRLTDHDVRNLQGRGAEVIVVNQNYTSEELSAECRGEAGTTPNHFSWKDTASPVPYRPSSRLSFRPASAASNLLTGKTRGQTGRLPSPTPRPTLALATAPFSFCRGCEPPCN